MPHYDKPYSRKWFRALEAFDPSKAEITRLALLRAGGNLDVCQICGDSPAADYQLIGDMEPDAVAVARLCDYCLNLKIAIHKEKFIPYKPANLDSHL
ncbi:MAG: hypothetical protein K8S20_14780 [Chloroflexi bacterium]|nr:hypothetical protein [Chloroflexota bacterium]